MLLNFTWCLIRNNETLPNSSELQALGNWRRSLRTSGLQTSLALGLQKLQVLNAGDVHQNFFLQKLQALDQKHNLQRLELFIRTSCPESSDASLAKLQNMLMLTIF